MGPDTRWRIALGLMIVFSGLAGWNIAADHGNWSARTMVLIALAGVAALIMRADEFKIPTTLRRVLVFAAKWILAGALIFWGLWGFVALIHYFWRNS